MSIFSDPVTHSNRIRKRFIKAQAPYFLTTLRAHGFYSLQFPAYIAVHEFTVTNSTMTCHASYTLPHQNESVLQNITKLFIRILYSYAVDVA